MKLAVLILSSALAFKAPVEKNRVYVLCYHGFLSDSNNFSFQLSEVKSHLDYLVKNGFTFVSVSDIMNNRVSGFKNVLVTVDDGNRTVYQTYRTVFKPLGIKPLLAIYPAIISVKNYALTWEQLKELADDGCDIAAHGYNHLFVNEKLSKSNSKAFSREINLSKSTLEKKLGRAIDIFVYPFGVRSEITRETLKTAGYKMAFTIEGRRLNPAELDGPDRYDLPRYMITRANWKYSIRDIAMDSTSAKPKLQLAMKSKKPAEGRKVNNVMNKPAMEPRVQREKYIYNRGDDVNTPGRGEEKLQTVSYTEKEKSLRRDGVDDGTKAKQGPMNITESRTAEKRGGNEKNEGKTGFLFHALGNTPGPGIGPRREASLMMHEKNEPSYFGRLREGYFGLVTGCYGIYDSWVSMIHVRIESIRNKFILLWKVLSA